MPSVSVSRHNVMVGVWAPLSQSQPSAAGSAMGDAPLRVLGTSSLRYATLNRPLLPCNFQ